MVVSVNGSFDGREESGSHCVAKRMHWEFLVWKFDSLTGLGRLIFAREFVCCKFFVQVI